MESRIVNRRAQAVIKPHKLVANFEKMLNLCSIFVALSFPIYEKK